ncbi:MAG: hypothetical protein JNJ69_04980 [Leptospiraceae bacterium]|nr:hypothetical protein [Leptospiraceae bacterium]
MGGVTRPVQRIIRLTALLATLGLISHGSAVPWREKPGIRFATTLPNRIIDSIMAQGNWNILFQEGPFAEFQRQIAIATHFSFRGQHAQAEQFFQRAETALEIAYATLRGKFGWPRKPESLQAADLAWGENRETFQDYILCRLQLYVESGLKKHETGEIKFSAFEATVAERQKQMGVPIRSKDADLDVFLRLLKESIDLRQTRNDAAQRFATLSDRTQITGKNFWQRRAQLFLIFENIRYGNLSRAFHLTLALRTRDSGQLDQLMLARLFVLVSDYATARDILNTALQDAENLTADSYADYIHYAELLQNVQLWLGDLAGAATTATNGAAHLQKFVDGDAIAREELFEVRTTIENQRLRTQKLNYLHNQQCPAASAAQNIDADRDIEWQVREHLFWETCGAPASKTYWRNVITAKSQTPEIRVLAAHALGSEGAKEIEKTGKQGQLTPLSAYIVSASRLSRALAKTGTIASSLVADHLQALNALNADLTFLDWGIRPTDELIKPALGRLQQKIPYRQALAIFSGLHRHYALKFLRGKPLLLFSPADAAALNARFSALLPERRQEEMPGEPPPTLSERDLVFIGHELQLEYRAAERKMHRAISGNFERPLLFGNISQLMTVVQPGYAGAAMAPLFHYCEQCSQNNKAAERLIIPRRMDKETQLAVTELADTFATTPAYRHFAECNAATGVSRDTLLLDSAVSDLLNLPCDISAERLVLVASPGLWQHSAAALAMGWRKDLYILVLPDALPLNNRTVFLYDLFQRTNRRQTKMHTAFDEARARAEKSFAQGNGLQAVQLYGTVSP